MGRAACRSTAIFCITTTATAPSPTSREASGIAAPDQNYSLGVLTGDFNGDGLTDIYVACDQTPSLLYINQGNGKFEEEGIFAAWRSMRAAKRFRAWA